MVRRKEAKFIEKLGSNWEVTVTDHMFFRNGTDKTLKNVQVEVTYEVEK